MKKRLRKKLRVGEFFDICIIIRGKFNHTLEDREIEEFVDAVCDYVDTTNLMCGGGTGPEEFEWMFSGKGYYRPTIPDRQCLADFFSNFKCLSSEDYVNFVLSNEKEFDEYFRDDKKFLERRGLLV